MEAISMIEREHWIFRLIIAVVVSFLVGATLLQSKQGVSSDSTEVTAYDSSGGATYVPHDQRRDEHQVHADHSHPPCVPVATDPCPELEKQSEATHSEGMSVEPGPEPARHTTVKTRRGVVARRPIGRF
jgi:hypothetical protein